MSTSQDTEPLRSTNVEAEEQIERRRSGRSEIVSPNLVQLLRDPTSVEEMLSDRVVIPHAALGAPKGLIIGLLFVTPFWATLLIVAYYLF